MKKFYAFEYKSGRSTTTGKPNKITGRYNIAGKLAVFNKKTDRDQWVENGHETSDMRGNCREVVSVKKSRNLHLGMTVGDYNEMIEFAIDD